LSIEPDRQLLHYRLIEKIGEGGMGVVWKAEDTTLQREVAIKILPDALAADAERLARFGREARMLASLNHPNIASVFGLHQADDVHFLAMELVRGEDLSERISRGALRVDDALAIARDVAEALRVAHANGMVHRDLKPANIRIGLEGEVKVLDFGLAKILSPDADGSSPGSAPSMSPTVTSLGTVAGVLLGTAAYMSPEQARGKPVDKRADVWAFGCVLFEMLAGKLVFAGDTITDTLAAVVRAEPDWDALPADLPRAVGKVLRLCLAKDPRERLNDIADAALLMEHGFEGDDVTDTPDAGKPRKASRREWLAWAVAAGAIVVAIAFLLGVGGERATSPTPTTRFTIQLDGETPLIVAETPILAFSPDGRTIAYEAKDPVSGGSMLYLRSIGQRDPWPLAGTESATCPFFSPDGEHIGFFSGGQLKRMPLGGGTPTPLADAANPRGAVWLPDDTIVYSPEYVTGLWRVPAAGGAPSPAVELDSEKGERTFRWPTVLPDGKTVLFTVGSTDSPNNYDNAGISAFSLDTGERHDILQGANMVRFLAPDKLAFTRGGDLYVVDFDPDSLETSGHPLSVQEGVGGDPSSGAGFFDVSRNGDLVHVAGSITDARSDLMIVDRDGQATPLPLEPRGFFHPRFAPDGSSIAFTVGRGSIGVNGDVWAYSFADEGMRRVTFGGSDLYPLWQPDGSRIAFLRAEDSTVVSTATDGSGATEVLAHGTPEVWLPSSWSPDQKTIALSLTGSSTDLYLFDIGEAEPRLFAKDASSPAISPDGRWLAYQSPASGTSVLYVQPLEGDGKWQVSPSRGGYPRWSPDGKRLFYLAIREPGRPVMELDVTTDTTFRFGMPRRLFDADAYVTSTAPILNWDTDGERFAFIERRREEGALQRIEVTLNWTHQLPGQ
jgi:serine/threonine-protein kinase